MDTDARSQIRLILDSVQENDRSAIRNEIRQIYTKRSSEGELRSGGTVREALRAIEESGEIMLKRAVDGITPIAKDVEAFAMLRTHVDSHMAFLAIEFDDVLRVAGGKKDGIVMSTLAREGLLRFAGIKSKVDRQVELHRFAFVQPDKEIRQGERLDVPTLTSLTANKGGMPLAKHWDKMWAAIAAMLYNGDLKPASQADIERAMKDWCAARDLSIGDTSIRERARALWSALQEG